MEVDKLWSEHDLEFVACCPLCGNSGGVVLHQDVDDYFYKVAKGGWRLFRCFGCHAAYLNPRPTRSSIYKAYSSYATHNRTERLPADKLNGIRRLQRLLANGYKNFNFGTKYRPSNFLGVFVAYCWPTKRALMDREFRHLHKAPGRVLDIGFGDGTFLMKAQDMGWDAVGIDIDPRVVDEARKIGLKAYLGHPADLPAEVGMFDAITMNHVIEHVHEPMKVLGQCYDLLKPGGMLWIETPNIESLGHRYFGKYWRGLEAPRHLVLFSVKGMRAALMRSGFVRIAHLRQTVIDLWSLSEKARLEYEHPWTPTSRRLPFWRMVANIRSRFSEEDKEFIAIVAFKEG